MTITVSRYHVLPPHMIEDAYSMYAEIFAEVNTLAAQRHLMTEEEFGVVAKDTRVVKYVAYDQAHEDRPSPLVSDMVGMSTLLNDFEAWPLLSPPYFERMFPEQYAAGELWYIGFVGVRPDTPLVFSALVREMFPVVAGGVACMDFCTRNVLRRLPEATLALLRRLCEETQVALLDSQGTYAYRFDGEPWPADAR